MPQIKRVAQAGKMNRDLDERLVPNGEYREALNVNIGRSEGSNVGSIENLLGNAMVSSGVDAGKVIGAYRDNGNERIYFFVTDNTIHGLYEFDQQTQLTSKLVSGTFLNFHQDYPIDGINVLDGLLFWTDDRNEPRKINIDRAKNDNEYYNSDAKTAVAKIAPIDAPSVGVIGLGGDSNFLEDKLVRFAYRYKFNDNEISTISLFTPIVFRNDNNFTDISDYIDSGEIATFVNQAKSVSLSLNIPGNKGITGVELLYKETTNNTIYIIDERDFNTDGVDSVPISFIYNSQDPFRAIPGNQTTRVYDAVPRVAKSQEVAGSRIVYGNFLQNYNLPNVSFSVTHIAGSHGVLSNHSVKSNRTYQVGLVLSDAFGRQSPVILSSTGSDTVFVPPQTDPDEFRRKLQVTFNNLDEIPDEWVNYRVVVKQREGEYYNWFTKGAADARIRRGDSVNKVSIDQTIQVASNAAARPSLEQVYRKVVGAGNVADTNPYRVSIAQNSTATVIDDDTTGSVFVYETKPQATNLDIFFETSTGGRLDSLSNPVVPVDFYNCYILNFGASVHAEINRLRAGFNEPFFDLGVKAYAVQENFAEERRANAMIHSSGLFNSRTGINQLNQFNEAEGGLILGLDPSDGSIQKLYAEDTQLLIFQEDKVSRSPIDKDFIYSAEGGAVPVTSSTQYLGTVAPYSGEYGISLDPGSFAVYGTRKYFTDKNRGVVLRLSNDGLSEISGAGMSDFFRDALKSSTNIIGSFDEYHNQYNLTIEGVAYDGFEDTNIATASDGYFTVSFEEDVKGWVSFKSFLQERGTTLNNTYYTFSNDLWEHNRMDADRNSFYGADPASSEVEFVFNDSPSAIKHFNTLSYEGTEGWVCDSIRTDIESIGADTPLMQYFTNTLQITGSVDNADVDGERAFTLTADGTVMWTITVTPRPGFQFAANHNVIFTFDDDLPVTGQSVNEDGTLTFLVNPRLIDQTRVIIPATITGQATLIETVTSITVQINDNIANADTSIDSEVFATLPALLDLVITPDADYYYDSVDQVTFTVNNLLHLGSVFTLINNNLNFDSQITATDGTSDYSYTFTGEPKFAPLTTYVEVNNHNTDNFNFVDPRIVPGETDRAEILVTADIEYVYLDDNPTSTISVGEITTTFVDEATVRVNTAVGFSETAQEVTITYAEPVAVEYTDPTVANFPATGYSPADVVVDTNSSFTASKGGETWFEIDQNDKTITITILEDNTTGAELTADITLDLARSATDRTITITQDA